MCIPALAVLAPAAAGTGTAAAAIGTLNAASIALGGYSAYTQAAAARGEARYRAQVGEQQAALARQQAAETERIGYDQAQATARKVAAVRAEQRAGLTASGVDITSGSAADILAATDYFGNIDIQTTAGNANKQAWGQRTEADIYASNAAAAGASAKAYNPLLATGVSLIGSAGNVADKWASRKISTGAQVYYSNAVQNGNIYSAPARVTVGK